MYACVAVVHTYQFIESLEKNNFVMLQNDLLHRLFQEESGTPFTRKGWQDATMLTFHRVSQETPSEADVTAIALLFEKPCDKD